MGAVYKALDTRLDRLVAIKVSTNQFAGSLSSVCDGGSGIPQGHVAVVGSVVEACNGTGPDFAAAWYYLGAATAVSGIGSPAEHYAKAYALRDRVSERERLTIEAF